MKMYCTVAVIILDICLHKIKQWKSLQTELQQGKQTNEAKIITGN